MLKETTIQTAAAMADSMALRGRKIAAGAGSAARLARNHGTSNLRATASTMSGLVSFPDRDERGNERRVDFSSEFCQMQWQQHKKATS